MVKEPFTRTGRKRNCADSIIVGQIFISRKGYLRRWGGQSKEVIWYNVDLTQCKAEFSKN